MHEHHIVEKLVGDIVAYCREKGGSKVTHVSLVIGEASGLSEESIRLYFETIAEGTCVEGATLVFKPSKVQFLCPQCKKTFEKDRSNFDCPTCLVQGMPTQSGKEFFIEKIDVI